MTDRIESNLADSHRAAALFRARITGDTDTFDHHIREAAALGRMPELTGPLIEIASMFMLTMIAKGAVDANGVLEWLDRLESALIAEELADDDGGADD